MNFNLGPLLGSDDRAVLRHVLSLHPPGVAAEFGVASGATLRMIAQQMPVTGFDSFTGLPEPWRHGYPAGKFACPVPTVPNADIVVGLFEDTLPGWTPPGPLGLAHIDCDLYSSTVTVLTLTELLILPGTYLVFDEFHSYPGCEEHEQRAFAEYVERTGLHYEAVGHGREQWACRIC